MTQTLYYSSNAVAMTLAAGIGSGDVTCNLSSTSGLPASFPFKLLLDWGTGTQEVAYCTALSGSIATIQRGKDGTTAQSHSIGAAVVHGVSAEEYNNGDLHRSSTGAVHGVAGTLVGTTDSQNLTNKTLTSPTFAGTAVGLNATGAVLDATSNLGGVSGTSLSSLSGLLSSWTTYTPTFTNISGAAGTFAYLKVGKTLKIRASFTAGTATAAGIVSMTLPASSSSVAVAQYLPNNSNASVAWYAPISSSVLSSIQSLTLGQSIVGTGFTGEIEIV